MMILVFSFWVLFFFPVHCEAHPGRVCIVGVEGRQHECIFVYFSHANENTGT